MTPSDAVFRPDRGNLLAAALMALTMLIFVSFKPLVLGWILIVPALIIFWCLNSRTELTSAGVRCVYAFKKNAEVSWTRIAGLEFAGASVRLRDSDGGQHRMPGVTFNDLPALSAASQGRIPDPITASQEAAHGKVEVVDRGGNAVLMTQEEYQQHLRAQQENKTPGPSGSTRYSRGH